MDTNKIKGYRNLHYWVERQLGKPEICEHCGKIERRSRFIDWANKSGEYKRNINDWLRLCRSCHSLYDYGNMCKKKLHKLEPANCYTRQNGKRECWACKRIYDTIRNEKVRLAKQGGEI